MLHDDDQLNDPKPNAYRVDDDNNIESDQHEEQDKPVREGQPMGGHNFGENNTTYSGDDKNIPSQNAGYRNEYFRRTEPSEEHPENNNFKPDEDNRTQEGTTDKNGPPQ